MRRVVDGIEEVVVGLACGSEHSLVTLAFGKGESGALGTRGGGEEALTPTAIEKFRINVLTLRE